MIIGPQVLPLLSAAARKDKTALIAAATRMLADRPTKIFAQPDLRRTILRNLDPGKLAELQHRLADAGGAPGDVERLAERTYWARAAGFFGLEPEETASAPAPLSRQPMSTAFPLFQHQRSVVRRAYTRVGDGRGRTLIHMPTGSGKTRTAMHLIARTLNESEPCLVVWLAASRELLEQAAETFETAWTALGNRQVEMHRFWGARSEQPSLTDGLLVAGLGKLHAWRQRDPIAFLQLSARVRLVVMDEAHQAIAPTYRALMDDLCGAGPHHALVGLSATPGRSWNDVAADEALSDYFDRSKVVLEVGDDPNPVKYLLDEGYLARPTFSQIGYDPQITPTASELKKLAAADDFPEESLVKLSGDTARNLSVLAAIQGLIARGRNRIILFAVSVEHAEVMAGALTAYGVKAAVVSGETPPSKRSAILQTYKAAGAEPMVVCNFGVLTTGFDAPRTSAAVIARPTKSLVLFSQMVGRATRGVRAGGNDECEILTVHDPAYPGFGDVAEAFFNWEDVWHDDD